MVLIHFLDIPRSNCTTCLQAFVHGSQTLKSDLTRWIISKSISDPCLSSRDRISEVNDMIMLLGPAVLIYKKCIGRSTTLLSLMAVIKYTAGQMLSFLISSGRISHVYGSRIASNSIIPFVPSIASIDRSSLSTPCAHASMFLSITP